MFKKKKNKVFCIGFNKTGTTSLERALSIHGYKMGEQIKGELIFDDWVKRDFRRTIELSRTAEAFQDIPFSLPFTFEVLDQNFPNSKFILTVRDSPQDWYESLIRFHANLWANGQRDQLTAEKLKSINYVTPGWAYRTIKFIYSTSDDNLYESQKLQETYEQHKNNVLEYFKYMPEKLLVINLKDPSSYSEFCDFLGQDPILDSFPKLNASV